MNQKQLRDYLFSNHYKPWPVQEAIKPHTNYQDYRRSLSSDYDSDVVVAFGSKSSQKVPRDEAKYIKLENAGVAEYYWVHQSEIFSYNLRRQLSDLSLIHI